MENKAACYSPEATITPFTIMNIMIWTISLIVLIRFCVKEEIQLVKKLLSGLLSTVAI